MTEYTNGAILEFAWDSAGQRMASEEIERILAADLNFYKLLGIEPDTPDFESVLKRNYLHLAIKVHPDKNLGNE